MLESIRKIVVPTDFDHTVDHVIQAGRKRIPMLSVPIRTNDKLRESRLFSSIPKFILRSLQIAVRVYSTYGAMMIFAALGFTTFMAGVALGLRFIYFVVCTDSSDLHVQSLLLAVLLMLAGFQMILTGIVADLISSSRAVLDDVSYRLRRMEEPEERKRDEK